MPEAIPPSTPSSTPARSAAVEVVRTLTAAGHAAYFAGGCVRDELLGCTPTDYDVATDATPPRVTALFPRTAAVGASFGVILVKSGPHTIEVATFRSDGPYTDRRRPDSVTFGSPEEDAQRRDYTINALFLDPLSTGSGVIDFVGGVPDLAARLLRAVGDPDQRLAEDHLRALRAVRLAAKLGFSVEPATAAAITRHARELRGVSRERIGEEICAMASYPARTTSAHLLAELLLEQPVFLIDGSRSQSPRTFPLLSGLPPQSDTPLALAAWAADLAGAYPDTPPTPSAFRRALSLSNDTRDAIAFYLRHLPLLTTEWPASSMARQKRLAAHPLFPNLLTLAHAANPALAATITANVETLACLYGGLAPERWVTGDHLAAWGLPPGPRYKTILEAVYDAQLEGRVTNPPQALELARSMGV